MGRTRSSAPAGTLALVPAVDDRRLPYLVAAGINPLVEDPSGFMAITASTLSEVAAVRPVNVRRLIALLRRLAAGRAPASSSSRTTGSCSESCG